MSNQARLVKQQREERALARIAKEHREREFARLMETDDGRKLLDLVDALRAASLDDWPGLVARQPWLHARDSDFRVTAIRLIGNAWDECAPRAGLDPMDEPLWPDEPSAFQQIRWALSSPPATAPAPHPAKRGLRTMLNITLTSREDVALLRDIVGDLNAMLSGASDRVVERVANAVTTATATAGTGDTAEPERRKRRTKAEMEADAAKDAAPAAPQPEPAPAPEPEPAEDDLDGLLDDGPAAPEEPNSPWAHCAKTTYTKDQVDKAFREWAVKAGGAATRAVLSHLKVGKSSEIKPEQYSELMAVLLGKPI